jgi:hypothetical protein
MSRRKNFFIPIHSECLSGYSHCAVDARNSWAADVCFVCDLWFLIWGTEGDRQKAPIKIGMR